MPANLGADDEIRAMNDLVQIRRALISVSDKTGIVDFAGSLVGLGVEIVSTGGSARVLRDADLAIRDVTDVTGFPEMLGGRLKTLHPHIHGGLLGRRDHPEDIAAMQQHGIAPIDLLVVNLYPFEQTVADGASMAECIENIDIGGPALIRAAAKNHDAVTVIVDPADYPVVLDELTSNNAAVTAQLRRRLAETAFGRTASYDADIAAFFAGVNGTPHPKRFILAGSDPQLMRYGENPHQAAAFYRTGDQRPGVGTARQLQGRELSYNNLNDTDAAFELVNEFSRPAVAIIKHANPCGVAEAETLAQAYAGAFDCDPTSAFGGIVAVNRPLDSDTAARIVEIMTEVVIAPELTPDAREILARRPNLRVLETGDRPDPAGGGRTVRTISGGILVQDRDSSIVRPEDMEVVTRRSPDQRELRDMQVAWRIAKHVKSNAIVYVRDGASVGIGAGQMSRVDSSRLAARKAHEVAAARGQAGPATIGSVVASDAFFPFADGLLAAIEAGATAVIQPGGAMRDADIIKAANEHDVAMVFTGTRNFRH